MKYTENIAYGFLFFMILTLSSAVTANDNSEVKLSGGYEFQSAFYDTNNPLVKNNSLKRRSDLRFNSYGHVDLEFRSEVGDCFEYKGVVALETTARNDRRVASYIHLISDYGKLEIGSDKSANNKMKITGYSVSCGTGGNWDVWVKLPQDDKKVAYVSNFGNFLDAKTRLFNKVEYSRKISYFTPKIYGLQLGISYVPDSSNVGYAGMDYFEVHQLAKPLPYKFGVTDGIAFGISLDKKYNDVDYKLSLVGERGKVRGYSAQNTPLDINFRNIRTYTIGSEINLSKFGFAASYSNYLKSLTEKSIDKIGTDTHLYCVGGKYKYNKAISGSITYFYGDHKNSKVNAVTAAVDYKIATGLLSYVDLTHYITDGRYLDNQEIKRDRTHGTLCIVGIKAKF